MPRAKHPIYEIDGIRFYRKPSGYYKADHEKHGGVYMHRYVWERANGPIPDGHHVHHINGVKHDNRLENLECLAAGAHTTHHMLEYNSTPHGRAASLAALEKGRGTAAEWHGSEAGLELHSRLGKQSWLGKLRSEQQCTHCEGTYLGYAHMVKRGFCSPTCQTAARIKSGVDDETRQCAACGCDFRANRYRKTRTCGKACWKTELARAKREGVRPDGPR